jgi:hypothetical protein
MPVVTLRDGKFVAKIERTVNSEHGGREPDRAGALDTIGRGLEEGTHVGASSVGAISPTFEHWANRGPADTTGLAEMGREMGFHMSAVQRHPFVVFVVGIALRTTPPDRHGGANNYRSQLLSLKRLTSASDVGRRSILVADRFRIFVRTCN